MRTSRTNEQSLTNAWESDIFGNPLFFQEQIGCQGSSVKNAINPRIPRADCVSSDCESDQWELCAFCSDSSASADTASKSAG